MKLIFEYDPRKAAVNLGKHRTSFAEAMTIFDDPLAATLPDRDHSEDEERFITIGTSAKQRVLYLSHTVVENRIRLISARPATPSERRQYEED